jgi:hypothetical protein
VKSQTVSMVAGVSSADLSEVGLHEILKDIGSEKYLAQVEQVRAVYKQGGKKAAGPLKGKLPAILFSGKK